MNIAERLRMLREQKQLSQGDIEKRTGLLRCYVSRVENGHTVPAIETLEKIARALEVPMYHLFYDGEEPPTGPTLKLRERNDWASSGEGRRVLAKLRSCLDRMDQRDRSLLLFIVKRMSARKRPITMTAFSSFKLTEEAKDK